MASCSAPRGSIGAACLSRGELRVDDGSERDDGAPCDEGDESEEATAKAGLEAFCDTLSTGYVRPSWDCCSDWVLRH
jgi:hypothetical protein